MAKKIIFFLMNIVFYIIYFFIFDYIIARKLPINAIWNIFSIFILTVINIPLSVATSVKVFSIIEGRERE